MLRANERREESTITLAAYITWSLVYARIKRRSTLFIKELKEFMRFIEAVSRFI